VEQKLFTFPEHMYFSPVLSGVRVARSLAFCVLFCTIVCSFVLFLLEIVLSILFLLEIALSILFRFTVSDYPFIINTS